MFITPEPEVFGIHTLRPTDRAQILQTFQRWNRTRDAAKSLNQMHHIDDATGPEDYEKATRDFDAAILTLLNPETREALADIATEAGVPAVVFLNVAVRRLVERNLPSHVTPGVSPR